MTSICTILALIFYIFMVKLLKNSGVPILIYMCAFSYAFAFPDWDK